MFFLFGASNRRRALTGYSRPDMLPDPERYGTAMPGGLLVAQLFKLCRHRLGICAARQNYSSYFCTGAYCCLTSTTRSTLMAFLSPGLAWGKRGPSNFTRAHTSNFWSGLAGSKTLSTSTWMSHQKEYR